MGSIPIVIKQFMLQFPHHSPLRCVSLYLIVFTLLLAYSKHILLSFLSSPFPMCDSYLKSIFGVRFWKVVERCGFESIHFITNFTTAKAFFLYKFGK